MDDRLFRGKRKDNGEWIYGYHFYDDFYKKAYITIGNHCMQLNHEAPNKRLLTAFEVALETVGESINYTDVNGKEIFDGDICIVTLVDPFGSDKQYVCKVEFKYACAYFQVINADKMNDIWLISVTNIGDIESDVEVIGNIYDNPEIFYGGEHDE